MAGSTIASSIDHSVTLGSAGYLSPLTITASGTINGSKGSGTALYIPAAGTPVSVENAGLILGAVGRVAGKTGLAGADGVYVSASGRISNSGEIGGGAGGAGVANAKGGITSGDGGIGVDIITSGFSLENKNTIYGGAGGAVSAVSTLSPLNGAGGDGVDIGVGSTLHNTGQISGGVGGYSGKYFSKATSYGGQGVSDDNGLFFNSGTIQGGIGGVGGTGLRLTGAGPTGRNTGLIIGGGSNVYSGYGGAGAYGGVGLIATDYAVFQNSGSIIGGVLQSGAWVINASLVNDGLIQAGADTGVPHDSSGGGAGVLFDGGRLVNKGIILGSEAGFADNVKEAANGGAGVAAAQGFINQGQISGGTGSYGNATGVGGYGILAVGAHISLGVVHNSGTVTGGDGGGGGGVEFSPRFGGLGGIGIGLQDGTLANTGTITGGNGGNDGYYTGGAGGAGVSVDLGNVINHGTINGGGGGAGVGNGVGGVGVYLTSATLTNTGKITGGNDGANPIQYHYSQGGIGGAGIYLREAFASNTGSITGGTGRYEAYYTGGSGGVGASVDVSSLVNRGVITGGAGGGGQYGGYGGDGVVLDNATLTNAGKISGGVAGVGTKTDSNGLSGDAVWLVGTSTLIVESGARFIGLVGADLTASDTLELAGKSSKALTGIGGQFAGFVTIAFAENAAWTISGTTGALARGEEITGFTSADAIKLTDTAAGDGSVTVATAGTVTIEAGGTAYMLDIAGATKGETDFSFANHILSKTSGAAMSFLAPASSGAIESETNLAAVFVPHANAGDFVPGLKVQAAFTLSAAALPGVVQHLFRPQQDPVLPGFTLHA